MKLCIAKTYKISDRDNRAIRNIDYPNPISLIGNFNFLTISISPAI